MGNDTAKLDPLKRVGLGYELPGKATKPPMVPFIYLFTGNILPEKAKDVE